MVLTRWAGVVCGIAFFAAVKQHLPFTSIHKAPPAVVAPLSSLDVKNGAYCEFRESWFTRKRHNQLTWLPAASSPGSFSLVLVVGDSYGDDVDMGFHCWPAQLGKALSVPVLNVARGGSESSDIHRQLKLAHDWAAQKGLDIDAEEALIVLHTGGNDALNSLMNPWNLAQLVSDLYRLRGQDEANLEHAFAEQLSRGIVQEFDRFLGDVSSLGYRKIVVSTVPIVSSLPLARLLVRLLVPGSDVSFVTFSLQQIGGRLNRVVKEELRALARKHQLQEPFSPPPPPPFFFSFGEPKGFA